MSKVMVRGDILHRKGGGKIIYLPIMYGNYQKYKRETIKYLMGDHSDWQYSAAHRNPDSDNFCYEKNGTGTGRQYICKTKGMCGFGREIL